jgi:hypothetical protein
MSPRALWQLTMALLSDIGIAANGDTPSVETLVAVSALRVVIWGGRAYGVVGFSAASWGRPGVAEPHAALN